MEDRVSLTGQMRYLLVVDSDWNERFTLSMLLQRFGYPVASTNNAEEGVEFLCVAPATAIFAEAGKVGTELITRLKADIRFRHVPIIMTSDSRDVDLETKLVRGDIAGLLRAPLDPHDVFQVLQEVIENGTRRNIRIATGLPAVMRSASGSVQGYATVLSQFGMFFRTLEPRSVKDRVGVELNVWDRVLSLEAEVLYIVTFEEGPFCEPGMGMKFLKIKPEDSAVIKLFIHEQLGMGMLPPRPGEGSAAGSA